MFVGHESLRVKNESTCSYDSYDSYDQSQCQVLHLPGTLVRAEFPQLFEPNVSLL